MKDEITATVILGIMIVFFTFTVNTLNIKTGRTIERIDKVEKHTQLTAEDIESIKNIWYKDKKPLLYFTTHTGIHAVDGYIEAAEKCFSVGKSELAFVNLNPP